MRTLFSLILSVTLFSITQNAHVNILPHGLGPFPFSFAQLRLLNADVDGQRSPARENGEDFVNVKMANRFSIRNVTQKGSSSELAVERRRLVTFGFGIGTLLLIVILQTGLYYATGGVSKSRDMYLKNYEEAVFKQISITLLVVSIITVGVQSRSVRLFLEHLFFSYALKQFHFNNSVNHHVDCILDGLLIVSLIFACLFLLFSMYLALVLFGLNRWLRRVDSVDPHAASFGTEGSNAAAQYLALRYEFEDAMQQSCVPGLDPPGLYFQNYCRACLFAIASNLLLVPPSTLMVFFILTLLSLFTPLYSLSGKGQIRAMVILSSVPVALNVALCLWVWLVKRKLVPRNPRKYLHVHHTMESIDVSTKELPSQTLLQSTIEEITLPYKLNQSHARSAIPDKLASLLYGTRYPNQHEQLFFFWRNGPAVLVHLVEIAIFAQLVLLAIFCKQYSNNTDVWSSKTQWPYASHCVLGVSLLQWPALPYLLWNLVVVKCTGGLVDDSVLQAVWETQRARTVHRLRVLVDTLRCEANLFKIERGGRQLRNQWTDRATIEDGAYFSHDDKAFKKLDAANTGYVSHGHIMRHLTAEGLPMRGEADAKRWTSAFDLKNKGALDREDFAVLCWNIRHLMHSPLDIDAVKALLCEKYALPIDGTIDVATLRAIFQKWELDWTPLHILHLFQYMTNKRGKKSIAVRAFILSLQSMEANTIGTLRQAADDLVHEPLEDDYQLSATRG